MNHARWTLYGLALLLVTPLTLSAGDTESQSFTHAESGVSLTLPAGFTRNAKASRKSPLSIVFSKGKAPMMISVHFKRTAKAGTTLEAWMKAERARWKTGKYESEMTETKRTVGGRPAIHLLRKSKIIGDIHMLVFASPKDKAIYSLYHVGSDTMDPKKTGLAAFEAMAKSLTFKS